MERGYPYEFTLDELGENVGLKVKNNSRGYEVVNNALTLLVNKHKNKKRGGILLIKMIISLLCVLRISY